MGKNISGRGNPKISQPKIRLFLKTRQKDGRRIKRVAQSLPRPMRDGKT